MMRARMASAVLIVALCLAGCGGADGTGGVTADSGRTLPTQTLPTQTLSTPTALPQTALSPTAPTPTPDVSTPPSASSPESGPSTSASSSTAPSLRVVRLAPGVNDEASGVAVATTATDRYYLVDDGTGASTLAVVDGQGALITRVQPAGMAAANAEALAAGSCGAAVPRPDGGTTLSCLYVGDIGDNAGRRPDIVVYRVPEPDLAEFAPGADPIVVGADEWRYTFPDRPQNAESMLVAPDGSIIVVTKPKNAAPHRIYRGEPGGGELTFVREFAVPGSPRPMRTILTGNVATDLAATPGRVLLLTYDDVHEYTAPDPAADPTTFPEWPHRSIPIPALPQAEGIAGAPDGCGYVIASEAGPGGDAGSLGFATCG